MQLIFSRSVASLGGNCGLRPSRVVLAHSKMEGVEDDAGE